MGGRWRKMPDRFRRCVSLANDAIKPFKPKARKHLWYRFLVSGIVNLRGLAGLHIACTVYVNAMRQRRRFFG